MPLLNDLLDFSDHPLMPPPSAQLFAEHLPVEWIQHCLTLSAHATVRRRRLPGDMVIWMVVAMAFFRNEPITDVVRRLNLSADGEAGMNLLARSAVTQARQRVGAAPVEWLFHQTAQTWGAERYLKDDWHGLQLFAIDGAQFRTPDEPELREHYGSANTSTERQSAYPVMRLVALMNLGSHMLLDAATAPYRRSEILMAQSLTASIPDNSVTLFDKLFYSADLLLTLSRQGNNRHWLLPARKNMVAETEESYGSGDRLLKLKVSPQARKKNPSLPEFWYARAVTYALNGVEKTVLTSLPADRYKAKDVAELYHSRWEIEVGFRNLKSSLLDNALVLRSRKVALLEQEVWGMLLACNLIRREATKAAEKHKKAPSEISFKFAFQFIATEMIVLGNTVSPGTIPKRLEHLRGNLEALFITKRPRPSRPRAVKISKTRYPVNRYAAPLK
ncbi:IS4 family transposase [Salmonella enterica subsp. enterica]|nr:IS4 family transposase [Salmonella enterica subsp. enterica]ECH9416648.1 IS4 family transposase [Salmonella enterica subsp. enterica]ECI2258315.1 IS4 family transposase [Salmonella enterica subsp. enterica]ECY4646240.1 IS4 family transposase [Salmonella enterica subsp. enterica serovar Eastbourne]